MAKVDAGNLQGYKTCPVCGCALYAWDTRPCKWGRKVKSNG